jgi:hypothetical protein
MTKVTSPGQAYDIVAMGGKLEAVPLSLSDIPVITHAAGNYTSPVIVADGLYNIVVGVKSNRAGAINVQRYIDEAGQVPIGAADTAPLTADTLAVLSISDGKAIGSYTVQITNTDGSLDATIAQFAMRNTSN